MCRRSSAAARRCSRSASATWRSRASRRRSSPIRTSAPLRDADRRPARARSAGRCRRGEEGGRIRAARRARERRTSGRLRVAGQPVPVSGAGGRPAPAGNLDAALQQAHEAAELDPTDAAHAGARSATSTRRARTSPRAIAAYAVGAGARAERRARGEDRGAARSGRARRRCRREFQAIEGSAGCRASSSRRSSACGSTTLLKRVRAGRRS